MYVLAEHKLSGELFQVIESYTENGMKFHKLRPLTTGKNPMLISLPVEYIKIISIRPNQKGAI